MEAHSPQHPKGNLVYIFTQIRGGWSVLLASLLAQCFSASFGTSFPLRTYRQLSSVILRKKRVQELFYESGVYLFALV